MIIKVGTANKIKVDAVWNTLVNYPELADAKVLGVNIVSGVSEQPWGMEETVQGALNRSLGAYCDGADLGIGIESGTMNGPLGWMNFTAVVICEKGTAVEASPRPRVKDLWERAHKSGIHFGHSTSFPLPLAVIHRMCEDNMDLDQAAYACGLVDIPNIGKVDGGFLGILTKGRVSRKLYIQQALRMALISYENKEMFL